MDRLLLLLLALAIGDLNVQPKPGERTIPIKKWNDTIRPPIPGRLWLIYLSIDFGSLLLRAVIKFVPLETKLRSISRVTALRLQTVLLCTKKQEALLQSQVGWRAVFTLQLRVHG